MDGITDLEETAYSAKIISWRKNGASEKEIETELYAQILNYYRQKHKDNHIIGDVSYSNPVNTDGIISIRTLEKDQCILIEAKKDGDYSKEKNVLIVLSQAIRYLRQLHLQGNLLPAAIILCSSQSLCIINVEQIFPIIEMDYTWNTRPSSLDVSLQKIIQKAKPNYIIFTYDRNFKFQLFLDKLNSILEQSSLYYIKGPNTNNDSRNMLPEIQDILSNIECYQDIDTKKWYIYDELIGVWKPTTLIQLRHELYKRLKKDLSWNNRSIMYKIDQITEIWMKHRKSETPLPRVGYIAFRGQNFNLETHQINPSTPYDYHQHYVDTILTKEDLFLARENAKKYPTTANFMADVIYSINSNKGRCFVINIEHGASIIKAAKKMFNNGYVEHTLHTINTACNMTAPNKGLIIVDATKDSPTSIISAIRKINSSWTKPVIFLMETKELFHLLALHNQVTVLNTQKEILLLNEKEIICCGLYGDRGKNNEGMDLLINSGDNIRLWIEECLQRDDNYYCLNEDLRDSYNNWLKEHGYNTISHKVFLDRLIEHDKFKELDLVMAQRMRAGKLHHSIWEDPTCINLPGYSPRTSHSGISSHVKYIKFI